MASIELGPTGCEKRAKERVEVERLIVAAGELATPELFEQARDAYVADMPSTD